MQISFGLGVYRFQSVLICSNVLEELVLVEESIVQEILYFSINRQHEDWR